jgi:hypothetical protein
VPDRGLIHWYRTGWEHRVEELEKSAAVLSHHLKFLQPGRSLVLPEAIERNVGRIGKLRSTAAEGLEWLAANPSPEAGVNVAFRSAWESYVEAADALNEIGTGAGIMTDQEYADRSRDAWGDARRAQHFAMETFSEAVAPARHPGNV